MGTGERKRFWLYLTDEEKTLLNNAAKKQGMSINAYIRNIVFEQLRESANVALDDSDAGDGLSKKTQTFELELTEREHKTLKLISTNAGITMSDYLRNCIRLKKLKLFNIDIKHHDLDEHTLLVGELTKKVVSVCNTISKSKTAYPQEVAKIIQLLAEINENNKSLLDIIYKDRKKLFLVAKKELLKNLRDAE